MLRKGGDFFPPSMSLHLPHQVRPVHAMVPAPAPQFSCQPTCADFLQLYGCLSYFLHAGNLIALLYRLRSPARVLGLVLNSQVVLHLGQLCAPHPPGAGWQSGPFAQCMRKPVCDTPAERDAKASSAHRLSLALPPASCLRAAAAAAPAGAAAAAACSAAAAAIFCAPLPLPLLLWHVQPRVACRNPAQAKLVAACGLQLVASSQRDAQRGDALGIHLHHLLHHLALPGEQEAGERDLHLAPLALAACQPGGQGWKGDRRGRGGKGGHPG